MTEPVLHSTTRKAVDSLLQKQPHAIMLISSRGSGKTYVAKYLASQLMHTVGEIDDHPYIKVLSPEPSSISIEQVRELQKFLSLKVPGNNVVKRICIIRKSDTLTTEAQNALLKILEEPPTDTVLLLLAETPQSLLPTILSRVQRVEILPLTNRQLQELSEMHGKYEESEIKRAMLLSHGRAHLFLALLSDDEHPLNQQIIAAKKFLMATQFERLTMITQYKEKNDVTAFLDALLITANAALRTAVAKNVPQDYKRWQQRCMVIFELQKKAELYVSARLLLTSLALEV